MENHQVNKIYKKEVLIFCPYYPPHVGGLESHAREFNEQISLLDYNVTVFTPRLPINGLKEEEFQLDNGHGTITVYRFPAWEIVNNYPLPKFWLGEFWRMYWKLSNKRYDAIISRTRFFNTSILALAFAKMTHTFWLHIEHGSDYVHLNNQITKLTAYVYDHSLGYLVFAMANKVVANSEASMEFSKKIYKKGEYTVIYRGVEKEKILSVVADEKQKDKYPNKIIITYIGRLIDGKGVVKLLEALNSLSFCPIVCWIIGDGSQKVYLQEKAKEFGLEEKVIFFGEKSHAESLALLRSSDIFVNPSYSEGLPTSVIEAALLGKAIIATDVGGTKEIVVKEGGIRLVQPRDEKGLASAIAELANDANLRKNMGEIAFMAVSDRFDWKESIRSYDEIFCQAFSTKK